MKRKTGLILVLLILTVALIALTLAACSFVSKITDKVSKNFADEQTQQEEQTPAEEQPAAEPEEQTPQQEVDPTPAHTHAYGDWRVVTEPSCLATGLKKRSCSCGAEESEPLAALGHDYASEVTAPTCTEKGYTTHTCTRCENSYVDEETAALGHDDAEKVVTAPTCMAGGYTTYTCSRCKESYVGDPTDPVDHDYQGIVTAPTCEAGGFTIFVCSYCSRRYVGDQTAALGHDDDEVVVTAPTCDTDGYTTYHCARCNKTRTADVVKALGHDYVFTGFEWTDFNAKVLLVCSHDSTHTDSRKATVTNSVTTTATCDHAGVRTYTAIYGAYTDKKTEELPKRDHTLGTVVPETPATCQQTGTKAHRECTLCNTLFLQEEDEWVPATAEDLVIPESHVFLFVAAKEVTCTEDGAKAHYECTACKQYFLEEEGEKVPVDPKDLVIPASHDFAITEVVAPTCTAQGYTVYTCSRCASSRADDHLPALGHDYQEVVTAPTCTEEGFTTYTCSRCSDSYVGEEKTPALGHDYLFDSFVWDGFTAQAKFVCSRDDAHVDLREATVTSEVTLSPTCTATGTRTYTARYEEESDTRTETLDKVPHSLGELTEEVPAGCLATGVAAHKTCTVCQTLFVNEKEEWIAVEAEVLVIPALGHDYEGAVTAPTCTEKGYTTYTCSRCSDSYVDDEVDALGHDYQGVVTPATCTEGGYTTYTCSRCPDSYVGDYTDELGHDYQASVTAPTCTEGGYTTYTCSRCSDSYVGDETEALGHDYLFDSFVWDGFTAQAKYICSHDDAHVMLYDATVTNEVTSTSTCSVHGIRTYTATYDEHQGTKEQELALEAHTYSDLIAAVEPTCQSKGVAEHYECTVCHALFVQEEEQMIPVTAKQLEIPENHVFLFHAGQEETCTENGVKPYYECTTCNGVFLEVNGEKVKVEQKDLVINARHDYEAAVTAPTCTEKGYTTYTCSRCSDSYVDDEVDALGHDHQAASVTPPTCIEKGHTTYVCSRCSDSYDDDYTDALGHDYEGEVTAPTCTEKGYTTYTCSRCSDSYVGDEVDALGHDHQKGEVVAPTCTEGGYTVYTCTRCDDSYHGDLKEALGHNYQAVVTAPTCTEKGYTTHTCTRCEDSYTDQETAALGHDYQAAVTAPTCTEGGYTTYTCSRCSDSYVDDEVDALGHEYAFVGFVWEGFTAQAKYICAHDASHVVLYDATVTSEVTATPTCSSTGTRTYTAQYDSHAAVKKQTLDALGHDYASEVTAPTCTEGGYTTHTCSRCKDSYTDQETDPLGHDYQKGETIDPTCTEGGYTVYTCTRCDNSYQGDQTATIDHDYCAKSHVKPGCETQGYTVYECLLCHDTYNGDYEDALGHNDTSVVTPATCTEGGYTTYTCSRCKRVTVGDEVEKLGHDYQETVTAPTCTEKGYTTHTCTRCEDSYVDDFTDALDHDYQKGEVVAPTCTEGGYTVYTCSSCDDSYHGDVKEALGHDYQAAVTAPTCTEGGYTAYTCSRCSDSYVDDHTDALGHAYAFDIFVWEGYTAQAKYICSHDASHVVLYDATVTSEVTAQPTCTEKGTRVYTARYDTHEEVKQQKLDALGHNYQSVVTPATCTEGGYTTHTCTRCKDSYTDQETDPLGHDHQGVVTPATCLEGGYTTYTCTRCPDSYVGDETDALGHDYQASVTAPTCTENGYTTHTCSRCGDNYVDTEVPPYGHDFEIYSVTSSSCTQAGKNTYICRICGERFEQPLPIGEHSYVVQEVVPPTCEAQGHTVYICEVCGYCYDDNFVPAVPVLSVNAQELRIEWEEEASHTATHYRVSVDNGSWTTPDYRNAVLSSKVATTHTIRVQSMKGEAEGGMATFTYETRAVSLSTLSMNNNVVTWTADAFAVSLTVNGSPATYTKSGNNYSYTCPATAGTYAITVTASDGYDLTNGIYYVTPQERNDSLKITKLTAPNPIANASGISWSAVSGTVTSYEYKMDNGAWNSLGSTRSIAYSDFSSSEGSHTIKIRAVGNGTTYLTSDDASFTYETKTVVVEDLWRPSDTLEVYWGSGDAVVNDYTVTVTKDGNAYSGGEVKIPVGGVFYYEFPDDIGTGDYKVTVSAPAGWNSAAKIYFYTASPVEKSFEFSVSTLKTPSFSTLSAGATSIAWGSVTGATGYQYSTNSGSTWTSTTGTTRSVSFSSSTGQNKIRVRAVSSDPTKLTSNASSDFTYVSTSTSLSDVTIEGTRAKWVASARKVDVKEGSGSYATTTLNYYDLTSLSAGNKTVTVKAYCGYDATNNIYYSGNDTERSGKKSITRANTYLSFNEGILDKTYSASGWTKPSNGAMFYKNDNPETGLVVNMKATSAAAWNYDYSGSGSLGLANSFSVDLGHYFSEGLVYYKIILVDTNDVIHMIAGSTNSYETLKKEGSNSKNNRVFHTLSYTGFDPIDVKCIRFEVKSNQDASWLYVDNLRLAYNTNGAPSTNASYSGSTFTVASGNTTTKSMGTTGKANYITFTLKNTSTDKRSYVDIKLYDTYSSVDYVVASGRYGLYPYSEYNYPFSNNTKQTFNRSFTFTMIFDTWRVKKFSVYAYTTDASTGNKGVEVSNVSIGYNADYNVTEHDTYRVADANSGTTSLKLMGANEVKYTVTSLSFTTAQIRQLQDSSNDLTPYFSYISDVKAIFSATYSQSIDVTSNSTSNDIYGTITIKYLEKNSTTLRTSSIKVYRTTNKTINNDDGGSSSREYSAKRLENSTRIDPHEVVLAGSSSMEKWRSFYQDMKGVSVVDVGIGGTRSTDWSGAGGLAERLIYPYNPRAVIMFVGVNDLKGSNASPLATAKSNVKALLTEINNNLPNAKIYYVLINIVPLAISGTSGNLTVSNVNSFNSEIKNWANSRNWVTTIELETAYGVTNPTSYGLVFNREYYGYDTFSFLDVMHLNVTGYTEWAYEIRKKFIALDKKQTWTVTD